VSVATETLDELAAQIKPGHILLTLGAPSPAWILLEVYWALSEWLRTNIPYFVDYADDLCRANWLNSGVLRLEQRRVQTLRLKAGKGKPLAEGPGYVQKQMAFFQQLNLMAYRKLIKGDNKSQAADYVGDNLPEPNDRDYVYKQYGKQIQQPGHEPIFLDILKKFPSK